MIIGTIVFFIGLIFILNVSSFMIYNSNLNKEITLILLLLAVGFIIQSIAEELLFRGCVFDNLLGCFTLTESCFIQAIIFSFVHLLNGNASVISFLTLIFFGLLMVLFRIIVNNLFFSTGFHFV